MAALALGYAPRGSKDTASRELLNVYVLELLPTNEPFKYKTAEPNWYARATLFLPIGIVTVKVSE